MTERAAPILAEIAELRLNRAAARKDARSGHPARRAQGREAAAAITTLINERHQLLKEDES